MTPYLRGNRDGLLSLVARLDAKVASLEAEVTRFRDATHSPNSVRARAGERLLVTAATRLQEVQACRDLALRMADALPHDPQEAP